MTAINSKQLSEMEKYYRINLINSLSGYKSLNLAGTVNDDGVTGLCPVSSVFHLGSNPPLLGMVMRPQRPNNDTLRNIKMTEHYTLNNVLPEWYEQAHQTSASYPSGVSEFEECGLNPLYMAGFKAPFVEQSTVRIGLELRELIDVKLNGTTIVIGEIVQLLIDEPVLTADGTIDHIQASTLAVAGLDSYFLPQLLGRLNYAKPTTAK